MVVSASAASADVSERIRVSTLGGPMTQGLPASVRLWVTSPPSYNRTTFTGTSGRWVGPRYAATGNGAVGGDTSITWSLRITQAKDAVAAANAALQNNWPMDLRGGLSVPHVVGTRTVGTFLGHYRLTHAPGGDSIAAYELGVAFAVAPRVFVQLRFEVPDPVSDDAGTAGKYVVNGLLASVWNRGQALWTMSALELHGALPPSRVSAKAVAGGRTVRGVVADAFTHPVGRAKVVLQRFTGGGWRKVASTRTNAGGVYIIRGITTRGRYRAVATLGAAAVRSAAVLAGAGTRGTT
jgi:hypothetical protein